MENKKKSLIIILVIVICVLGYVFIRNINSTIRGIVVKVNGTSIIVMHAKDETLYTISIPENNNLQFKQGQEILVHYKYGTIIEQTNPAEIRKEDIKKITILKEKSNVEIPREKMGKVYNTDENVLITIDELSLTGLSITINDTNEFKREYEYSDSYTVSKGKHNDGYIELNKNNNIKTIVNSVKIDNSGTIKNTYNWENIYGKLESGEYILLR